MRVSKADGSQTTDLQRDALLAAGTDPESLYEDKASGKKEDRPELAACLKALRHDDTWSSESSTGSAGTCATWSTSSTTSPNAASA
jgi:hypothetical protein